MIKLSIKKSASTVSKKRYKVSITKLVVKSIGKIFSKGFIIYDSILGVNDFINEVSRHDLIEGDKFSIKTSASTISWKRYKISITKLAERSQMRVLKSSTDYFSEKTTKITESITNFKMGKSAFKKRNKTKINLMTK